MTEKVRSEKEWQIIRSAIEKAEGGKGFSIEFKVVEENDNELLIVTDLDTNDKSLDIFPNPEKTSNNS